MIGLTRNSLGGPLVVSGFHDLNLPWFGHSANPSVVVLGGTVYLYFRGIDISGVNAVCMWSRPLAGFDGKTWTTKRTTAVLSPTPGGKDAAGLFDPAAIVVGSTIYLYYASSTGASGATGYIYCATSTDGVNFTKVTAPCMTGYYTPAAINFGGTYYLYATAPDPGGVYPYALFRCNGTDGKVFNTPVWQPQLQATGTAGAFDRDHIEATRFLVENGYVYFFYAGGNNTGHDYPEGIGIFRSTDLNTWTRCSHPVFLRGASGDWDEAAVWSPAMIRANGRLFMFYEGVGTGNGAGGGSDSNTARDTQYGLYNTKSFSQVGYASDSWFADLLDWDPVSNDLPPGNYYIRNMASGKFMCPAGGAISTSTLICQYGLTTAAHAKWYFQLTNGFWRISNADAGSPGAQVLEIPGSDRSSQRQAGLYPSNGYPTQQWHLVPSGPLGTAEGSYAIVNRNSGQLLSCPSTSEGCAVVQVPDRGALQHRWELFAA